MPPIELLHKIFGWPGIAALCGVLPVVCASLLLHSAWRSRQVQWVAHTSLLSVSTLKPSEQPVRLKGRIVGVSQPLAAQDPAGRAVLGVHVEELLDEEGTWETRIFRLETTPFWLDDGTGLILVNPAHLDREYLGEGFIPSQEQLEEIIQTIGCSPAHVREPGLRFRVWELRKGQQVTVVGVVSERDGHNTIAKAEGHPLVITAMDETSLDKHSVRHAKLALFWAILLGVPGLFVLFFSLREIVHLVGRLLHGD